MSLSCALIGLGAISLGLISNFWLYLACMCVVGIVMPLYNIPNMALLQSKVENVFMGRVFGVYSMISSVMMPVGMIIFGPLADIIVIDILLIVSGLVIFIMSFTFIISKELRDAGKPVIL
jgi:DHA3 family macrolide efflux protein-like MFS transporter